MKKTILFILALVFPLMANAQYAPAPDYTQTKEFKVADTMAKTGIGILIASGVGITTGNIICVVQENGMKPGSSPVTRQASSLKECLLGRPWLAQPFSL